MCLSKPVCLNFFSNVFLTLKTCFFFFRGCVGRNDCCVGLRTQPRIATPGSTGNKNLMMSVQDALPDEIQDQPLCPLAPVVLTLVGELRPPMRCLGGQASHQATL